MRKNDSDWKVKIGDFEFADNTTGTLYFIEIGYSNYEGGDAEGIKFSNLVYMRLWKNDDFYVGTYLPVFKESREQKYFSEIPSTIEERLEALPPNVLDTCIKYGERAESLKAFI